MKTKKYYICTPEQFNSLIDFWNLNNYKYDTEYFGAYARARTADAIFTVSLTSNDKDIINIGALANKFYNKCKVHDITGLYGYKEEYDSVGKKHIKWDYEVAFGYQYADEYYALKPLKCWSYDINSAFPYAMLQPMPDTRKEPRFNDIIKKGEIGFYKHGGASTDVGDFAEIIFPLMDSPFKEYVYEYYKLKNLSSGKDKEMYKQYLNFPTGLLARKNIFLRNALIYYSNKYIKRFIDEYTVYCNVDCIVSLVPRADLPIGNEIGQFKVEHECEDFKYKQSCIYQWKDECHYSGIPKGSIKDIEDTSEWYLHLKYKYENGKVILNEEK